jgi:hypothetical protein
MVSFPALSDKDLQFGFPVCWRILAALSDRILSAEVSGRQKNVRTSVNADIHRIAHIVHLQLCS